MSGTVDSGAGGRAAPLVAIDVRMAGHTGIGRYLRGLVNALLARDDPFDLLLIANPTRDPTAVWDWVEVSEERRPRVRIASFGKPVPIYSVAEQAWIPRVVASYGADLLHVPHFNIPLRPGVPMTVTLHDAIYLSHPESARSRAGRMYAAFMLKEAARRAAAVLTVSEASRDELAERLGLERAAVTVAPQGAEEMAGWLMGLRRGSCEVISPRVKRLPPFLLAVGATRPHKDPETAVATLAEVSKLGFPDLHLVFVGARGRDGDAVESAARRHGLAGRVLMLGELPDRDLAWLYDNARALLHTSRAEGFGLPVLEAFAAECPVVASDIPALRELAGKAARLCPPGQPKAFAAALGRLLINPKEAEGLARLGMARCGELRTEEGARRTAELWLSLLGSAAD